MNKIIEDKENEITKIKENERLILLTAHRRENLGEPMRHFFKAISKLVCRSSR